MRNPARHLGKTILLWASALSACAGFQILAQASSSHSDDVFAKYPADSSFKDRPVPPLLSDPAVRLFRTRIREGVAQGVAFAGHYEVAVWGCGGGCTSFAVIDAVTGRVSSFPASVSSVREVGERLTYKRNSRAIHVVGALNEKDSADRWYVWDGNKFNLVSEKPAVLADDDGR